MNIEEARANVEALFSCHDCIQKDKKIKKLEQDIEVLQKIKGNMHERYKHAMRLYNNEREKVEAFDLLARNP